MPVSPQDFELYSRMTGAPMPTDAMSRMQMAPEVFKFTKDFAKKPNILEKTGNLVKNIGRGAVMALGAPLVAASEAENARIQEQLRNKADVKQSEAVTMEDPVEEVAPEPELTAVEKGEKAKRETAKFKTDEMIRLEKARAKLRNITDENIETYSIPANLTTADSYGQDYVPNQTATNLVDRKMEQGSQIADSTPNIAEVLSETQDSQPSEEMVGGADKEFIAKFRKKNNLDKALKGVFKLGQQEEELIDDSTIVQSASPLNDHVDTEPGENAGNVPSNKFNQVSGTNTSSTENLNDFYKEMRRMDTMERNKEAIDQIVEQAPTPSEKQVGRSPNELAGKDQETFEAIKAGIPQEEQEAARMRIKEKTSEKRRQFTAKKADDFKARFVEGALSDIVRGARSKKSLGITRIPATNGDAQVGFVLADKAVPEMPKNVPLDSPLRDETGALRNPYGGAKYSTTYGFGVAPGAEDMLQNQITDKDSFSNYMRRGLGEAKEGKRRKAGEIFEFLPPSARIVSGTARLDDIVM